MVDIPTLVQAAHGGEVVGNLAQQHGLSQAQTQAAIDSLTPAIAHGLNNQIQTGEGLTQVAIALNDPAHAQAYADPAATQAPEPAVAGDALLHTIFGAEGLSEVVNHIATETGIETEKLRELASTYASVVAGGIGKAIEESGLGDLLAQAANAPEQPAEAPKAAPPALGLGYVVSDLVSPLFNNLFKFLFPKKPAAPTPAPVATPAPAAEPAAPEGVAALSELFKTVQAPEPLQNVLGQVFAKR
jgi:hypothetical protein